MRPAIEAAGPKLSIEGVSRVFGGPRGQVTEALSPVDLTVRANDFISILGPSGCGKSTLLRIVAGLDRPSAGPARAGARGAPGPAPDAVGRQPRQVGLDAHRPPAPRRRPTGA